MYLNNQNAVFSLKSEQSGSTKVQPLHMANHMGKKVASQNYSGNEHTPYAAGSMELYKAS